MKKILIIKCGNTFPSVEAKAGDYEDFIMEISNLPSSVFDVYHLPAGDRLRHPGDYFAAIITGSPFSANGNSFWIKQLINWVVEAKYCNIPVLGIGFGARIIARSLGGAVSAVSVGSIFGGVEIINNGKSLKDELFGKLPDHFKGYVNYTEKVDILPADALLLAQDSKKNIMGFKVGRLYGVQYQADYDNRIMKIIGKNIFNYIPPSGEVKLKNDYNNNLIVSEFVGLIVKN